MKSRGRKDAHMLDIGQIERIVSEVIAEYGVAKVELYGPYARGEAAEGAPVDLAVEIARPLGAKRKQLASELEEALGVPANIVLGADKMPDPERRRFEDEKILLYTRPKFKSRVRTIEYDE